MVHSFLKRGLDEFEKLKFSLKIGRLKLCGFLNYLSKIHFLFHNNNNITEHHRLRALNAPCSTKAITHFIFLNIR